MIRGVGSHSRCVTKTIQLTACLTWFWVSSADSHVSTCGQSLWTEDRPAALLGTHCIIIVMAQLIRSLSVGVPKDTDKLKH